MKELNEISNLIKQDKLIDAKAYISRIPVKFQEWLNILFDAPGATAEDELSLIISQKRIALERPLDWLNLFAITSPMLGLLGTIWSMSHSFALISTANLSGGGMQKMITYLSEAMYATAFGISLALTSMFFLYLLRQKFEGYLSDCEIALNRLHIDIMRNKVGSQK